jgi:hypothetical protein
MNIVESKEGNRLPQSCQIDRIPKKDPTYFGKL